MSDRHDPETRARAALALAAERLANAARSLVDAENAFRQAEKAKPTTVDGGRFRQIGNSIEQLRGVLLTQVDRL